MWRNRTVQSSTLLCLTSGEHAAYCRPQSTTHTLYLLPLDLHSAVIAPLFLAKLTLLSVGPCVPCSPCSSSSSVSFVWSRLVRWCVQALSVSGVPRCFASLSVCVCVCARDLRLVLMASLDTASTCFHLSVPQSLALLVQKQDYRALGIPDLVSFPWVLFIVGGFSLLPGQLFITTVCVRVSTFSINQLRKTRKQMERNRLVRLSHQPTYLCMTDHTCCYL